MHTITPLTPFQRGQAALQDALAHVDYAANSDERMQFLSGLLDAVFAPANGGVPSLQALVSKAASQVSAELPAELAADLVKARRESEDLRRVLHDMVQQLAPVIGAHLRGDGAGVHKALTTFVEARCKVIHLDSPAAGSGSTH